jgi:hypothetical protein
MAEITSRCSEFLAKYIGEIQITAQRRSEGFERYSYFCESLEKLEHLERSGRLSDLRITGEESRLAKSILAQWIIQAKPQNIGRASGEPGEAD